MTTTVDAIPILLVIRSRAVVVNRNSRNRKREQEQPMKQTIKTAATTPSRASGYPLAPSQTRMCRFPASGSSGGRLAREHRLAPAFSARSRYPLLFGGRISMFSAA